MFNYNENIDKMRQIYHSRTGFSKNSLPMPSTWMQQPTEPLSQVHKNRKQLYREGKVFYGCLVQANSNLFSNKIISTNLPANIIYSTDPYYDTHPEELRDVASELYKYKNTYGAPEGINQVTTALTDEYERLFNIELPNYIANGRRVYFTTIIVFRKHLPKHRLIGPIFPIIARPPLVNTSIILPNRYWTKEMIEHFCEE